jgi:multidrug efflux pump subunit AcrB
VTFFFRRPRYLALALLMIAALGLNALNGIGRQEDPTITNLFATILTSFPGADPERVEALVTEKLEAELRAIPEIDEIESRSLTGLSSIQIKLQDTLSDSRLEQVWSEARDALVDAALPAGAAEPTFDNDRVGAFTAIFALTAAPGVATPPPVLGRLADELRERLRRVPSTKLVSVYGAPEEEVRVTMDPDALAALGLAPQDVAGALRAADAKVSAGRVRGAGADYVVEVAGEIDSLARVRETPLALGADGRVARVADVAQVARAVREPPEEIARAGGARAVLVAARVEDDRQVDRWAAAVRAAADRFRAEAPGGFTLTQTFDQSAYTASRLWDVTANLGLGVAIVVAVLFLTLGWRSALVVAAALPLTALLSLVVLEKLGIVIHQMSVTGMIVALGLLVDAAIVTTDEVGQRLRAGASRLAAVRGAVKRLAAPLAASTLTTVLAFVPMAALPGPAGDFVGAIAIAVIVMLCASLALALLITPALAAFSLRPDPEGRAAWWRDGVRAASLSRMFAASLDAALRWRGLAMAMAAAPAIVGFLAFPTLTAQFFPGVDRDQFYVQLDLGAGTAIGRTAEAAAAAEAVIRAEPGVVAVQWVIGRNAPAFYYNMLAARDQAPGFAEALVTTESPAATDAAIPRIQQALDAALPQARALARGLVQGPPVVAPLELRLAGPDLGVLRALGERARLIMAQTPAVIHTTADLGGGPPKLVFEIDEDRARLAGFTLAEIAAQLAALGEGALGGSWVEGPQELPVRVRLPAADRADAARLAQLTLTPPDADPSAALPPAVPLSALGETRLAPSESAIARRQGERVNTVRGYLRHGVLPEEALANLRQRLAADPLPLPAGYRIEWGGDSDARGDTIRNLMSVVGLVIAATVATVVLTFNSWRLSVVAFAVAGLSAGLSLLALEIFRFPFGINALIGVIGSIGVSVNAAIIILTALQEDAGAAAGDRDAMRDVVMRAGRHIVSTTVTTFGGFLPLILAGGGFWPPFAMAIAGGVLLSTVTSFYFTPPAFALLARRSPRAAASFAAPARIAAE